MTNIKKAIKHFENMRDNAIVVLDSGFGTKPNENNSMYVRRKLYAELAIDALEKQIPKKPILSDRQAIRYAMQYTCPSCGMDFTGTGIADYCYHCGQALDWSDEND